MFERDKILEVRRRMVDPLRAIARTLRPCSGVNDALIHMITQQIQDGAFCLSAVIGLPGAYKTCLKEYLCSEARGGYHVSGVDPRASVVVCNISNEPLQFTSGVKHVRSPRSSRRFTLGTSINIRNRYVLKAGDTVRLPSGIGMHLLWKYCAPAHHEYAKQLGMYEPPRDCLREVEGSLFIYENADGDFSPNGTEISWGVKPKRKRKSKADIPPEQQVASDSV